MKTVITLSGHPDSRHARALYGSGRRSKTPIASFKICHLQLHGRIYSRVCCRAGADGIIMSSINKRAAVCPTRSTRDNSALQERREALTFKQGTFPPHSLGRTHQQILLQGTLSALKG